MKIARATIEDFRHIEGLELNFEDSVGRVRELSLLVGPNTSGKTTVLDALAAALSPCLLLSCTRPELRLTPRNVVRRGALRAKVSCCVRFTDDEIDAVRELVRLSEENWEVPQANEVRVEWTYPDTSNRYKYGSVAYEPRHGWTLFKGRLKVIELLRTGVVDWDWFKRVGSVFTFDQQRTGMAKTIPRDIWSIIKGESLEQDLDPDKRKTSDPREILLSLAIKAQMERSQGPDTTEFELIRQKYGEFCAPHSIKGTDTDDLRELDVLFSDGRYDYLYRNLSSGEQMLLLFLIRLVTEHIHQSVVLVDEIELHQHPLWQRKLLHLLPRAGEGNQIIATTHSPYLRDAVPNDAVEELGELA